MLSFFLSNSDRYPHSISTRSVNVFSEDPTLKRTQERLHQVMANTPKDTIAMEKALLAYDNALVAASETARTR